MIRYVFLLTLLTAYFFIDIIDYLLTPYFKGLLILGASFIGIYDIFVAIKKKKVRSVIFLLIIALTWIIQSLKDPILSLYFYSRLSGITIFIFVIRSLIKFSTEQHQKFIKIYLAFTVITIIGIFLDKFYPEILSPIQKYDMDRAYFLLGTSSNIFICLAPGYYLLVSKIKGVKRFVFSMIFLTAAFISGGRLALFLFIILFITQLNLHKSKLFILGLLTMILLNYTIIYDAILAFITLDSGNSMRVNYWIYIIELFEPKMIVFGDGLGYLLTPNSIYPSKHFESSLIVLVIESGLLITIYLYVFWFKYIWANSSKLLATLFLINSIVVPMFPGPLFGLMSGLLIVSKEKKYDS